MVAPKCIAVLTDLGNFFLEFNDFYDDYDLMKENIELLFESSKDINHGLIMLEQIHGPVYRETKMNADKIEVVIQEISQVDDELRREYDKIKSEQSELLQKAQQIKPNEIWKKIPLFKYWMYDKQMGKVSILND